jgi:hypothetical protein
MPDKVKSKDQRRLMGMAKGIQDGELPASTSPAAAKVARTMNPGDLSDFAGTPEAGLPERAAKPRPNRPRPMQRKPKEIKTTLRHIRKF